MNYYLTMSHHKQEVQIFSRVSNIPLVNSALILAYDIYGRIKNYNGLVNVTLSTTEHSITYVANATPVTQVTKKLEKQINFADTMACSGLDSLEKKVPSIKKSPKEIKGEVQKLVMEVKVYGLNKISIIKKVSFAKQLDLLLERPFIKEIRETLSQYLDAVEKTVDHYLPPNEEQKTDLQTKDLMARVVHLPSKIHERVHERYNQFIARITWK